MRIRVKGSVYQPSYSSFEDTYVASTAEEIHDLRKLLSADGVHIESMQDIDSGVYYFTAGEVEAMGHGCFSEPDNRIFVYVSDGIQLHYDRIMV